MLLKVRVFRHANVVQVIANESVRAIDAVQVRHFDGRTMLVRATQFVLACSTMQNVRLLLASNERATAGLGNAHDQVGRYFAEHLEMPAGTAVLTRPQSMQLYAYDFGITKARAELRLTDAQQQSHGVLNATVALDPAPETGNALSTFEAESPEEVELYRRATKDSLTADMKGTAHVFRCGAG